MKQFVIPNEDELKYISGGCDCHCQGMYNNEDKAHIGLKKDEEECRNGCFLYGLSSFRSRHWGLDYCN